MKDKPDLSIWMIFVMTFGMFGVNFGWGLQMANMSIIYKCLGADPSSLPYLWIAAPLTGLLVQPFIGKWSDKTWTRLGRRRPYLLGGAIVASVAIVLMPFSVGIIMAAILLWLLDGSVNVTMGPYKAYVADNLNAKQMTLGFSMLSAIIAAATVISSCMPYILDHVFHVSSVDQAGAIPETIKVSFIIGALVFFLSVAWSVFKGEEYPPDNMKEFREYQKTKTSVIKDLWRDLWAMPKTMKQLAWVQCFAWMGLFCMFIYYSVMIGTHLCNGNNAMGAELGGTSFAIFAVVSFFAAMFIPKLSKIISRKFVLIFCLLCGGAGLLSVYFMHSTSLIVLSMPMVGIGIMKAGIEAIPFAILGDVVPQEKMGVFMGVFNLFITIPEILIAMFFGLVMTYILGNNVVYAVMTGGVFMVIAAILTFRVDDSKKGNNNDNIDTSEKTVTEAIV